LLRSKNFVPQFWHWRLAPSSGLANFSAADRNIDLFSVIAARFQCIRKAPDTALLLWVYL
jgi:hypothetical protein